MDVEFKITEEFLELFATGTLTGALLHEFGSIPQKLALIFPQTSLSWRRANGGPKHYVMSEFVPMCLVEDILQLIRNGTEIEVREERIP